MSETSFEAAIVMADISGSSALYDGIGDGDALRLVGACLDQLAAIVVREGGTVIRSKGDDVLAIFADPAAAFAASRAMLSQPMSDGSLTIHVGATFGNVIRARDDIFGDSVNTAARLGSIAKPGELLVADSFYDRLPAAERGQLQPLDTITFKGKNAPTRIYTLFGEGSLMRTIVGGSRPRAQADESRRETTGVSASLSYGERSFSCAERATLRIGRAVDNDVVIEKPWVSREHATLQVRRGKAQLTDRSSSGTFVEVAPGYEFLLKRETVLLAGSGYISPGLPPAAPEAEVIRFEIAPATADPAVADQEP